MSHTFIDKRKGDKPVGEACRVCGAPDVHTRDYSKPTMDCIKWLRSRITELEKQLQPFTQDEINAIRYSLNELANRRHEQGIDLKAQHCLDEARKLRILAGRLTEKIPGT